MSTPDKLSDGPQAATRHVKDRRPAYSTEAATSIASLEHRLAALEGPHSTSPRTNKLPKSDAASHVDAALLKYGEMYNVLEERLAELEQMNEERQTLEATVARIEERLKPYGEYQQQALAAVEQLQQVKNRIQPASSSKTDSTVLDLSQPINDHEASIREYHGRLLQVEDRNEIVKAQPLSTHDLAQTLIQRLKRGDSLNHATAQSLHLALESSSSGSAEITGSVPRQQDTPVTEESDAHQAPIERSIEPSTHSHSPARKRRRIGQSPRPARSTTTTGAEPRHSEEPQARSALNSFRCGGFSVDQRGEDDAEAVAEDEDVVIPPEIRRTSRQAKPTKHHPDFVHWRDANKRIKGIRPSASSPRKSAV